MEAFARKRQLDLRVVGLVAVILFDVLFAGIVLRQIITFRHHAFDADEAMHAMRGLMLTSDLRRGDLGAFLQHSYQQNIYPPGVAWFEALFFLAFGVSALTARAWSLACLLGSTLVLYAIALELDQDHGWLIGIVAVGLTLTAQNILVLAALSMLEMPGLLVSLATLWAYIRAIKRPTPRRFVVTSLLMALTVLAKYTFGVFVAPTIGLAELLAVLFPPVRQGVRATALRWLWLFLPFALVMAAWFVGEDTLYGFRIYANLQPKQADWYSLVNLTFYPRSIALYDIPSPFFAPVALVGFIWAALQRRQELRVLFLYFYIGFLVLTVKESNNPRFIATVVPALHLLTGAMLVRLIIAWRENRSRSRYKVALATSGLILSLITSLPLVVERFAAFPSLLEVEYETDLRVNQLYAWIAEQTHGQRIYLINPWDQFSVPAMNWYLATHDAPHDRRAGDRLARGNYLSNLTPEHAEELESDIRSHGTRYVVALEGGREGLQVWTEYEQAFAHILEPVASREFVLEYYRQEMMLVTRDRLAQAKAKHRLILNVQATVYRLLN